VKLGFGTGQFLDGGYLGSPQTKGVLK